MSNLIIDNDVKVLVSKKLLDEIDLYFRSGNSINSDRATIPFVKWEPIQKEMRESISVRYLEKEV